MANSVTTATGVSATRVAVTTVPATAGGNAVATAAPVTAMTGHHLTIAAQQGDTYDREEDRDPQQ
jgi:hypothetical protein